jgi:four helix bundle protein
MNREYDIHERIFNFVIAVIELLNKLPKTPTNLILIGQLTRSVTSMGANDQEADGASLTNDFLHCYTIVRKEGKESIFWLRVIAGTNPPNENEATSLVQEGNEIVAIISTIIAKTQTNRRKK